MVKEWGTMSSFVNGADNSFFPLENLPYGIFTKKDDNQARVGVAIGDYILDLAVLESEGLLAVGNTQAVFNRPSLNRFASLGFGAWSAIRLRLQELLSHDSKLQENTQLLKEALISTRDVNMQIPFKIENYTDFYASEQHASNIGRLFRPDSEPLLPNWKRLPVAYHGRASTVFSSGKKIIRPEGQISSSLQAPPTFQPTRKLDFELELGFFIGEGNPDGVPISLERAHSHIFGCVLLNDWSARDIQAFEYVPLGPFLSKSFATSISPWVVQLAALDPVMVTLPHQDPEPVSYLNQKNPSLPDIYLRVEIQPQSSSLRTLICETSCKELYWSMEQMLAHHTINHCIMRPGDLLGTGTISGKNRENWGSLMEITFNGKEPITLADGSKRTFLEDGDSVIMTGYYVVNGKKLGFGAVEGTVLPSN